MVIILTNEVNYLYLDKILNLIIFPVSCRCFDTFFFFGKYNFSFHISNLVILYLNQNKKLHIILTGNLACISYLKKVVQRSRRIFDQLVQDLVCMIPYIPEHNIVSDFHLLIHCHYWFSLDFHVSCMFIKRFLHSFLFCGRV